MLKGMGINILNQNKIRASVNNEYHSYDALHCIQSNCYRMIYMDFYKKDLQYSLKC